MNLPKLLDAPRSCILLLLVVQALPLGKICRASFLAGAGQEAADIQPWLVGLRRELHQIPELMYEEAETGKLIRRTLEDLGISYR